MARHGHPHLVPVGCGVLGWPSCSCGRRLACLPQPSRCWAPRATSTSVLTRRCLAAGSSAISTWGATRSPGVDTRLSERLPKGVDQKGVGKQPGAGRWLSAAAATSSLPTPSGVIGQTAMLVGTDGFSQTLTRNLRKSCAVSFQKYLMSV